MIKAKVKNCPGLVRDTFSKAIISEDTDAYKAYMQEKRLRETVSNVQQDVQNLKNDLADIKSCLNQLLQAINIKN